MFTKAAELIISGYLEAYILGALSPEDELMVQTWLPNEEVREAFAGLEDALFKLAAAQVISPPEHIGRKLNIG